MNKKIIVVILLLCVVLCMGCLEEDIYVETNADKCERIAKEYFNSHTYVNNDVYDCDNMACDIWNILKTEGINSKIAIGNVDYKIDSIEDADHA